jgi:hypothetical protein
MANYNALKYVFIFRKSDNIWNSSYEFEKDLTDFLVANGLEAETIQTVEGNNADRMFIIKKIELIPTLQNTKGVNLPKNPPQITSQKSKDIIKNLTNSLGKPTKGGRQ